jgi:hypothetical protein
LAGLRRGSTSTRRFDSLIQRGGDCRLARRATDQPRRPALVFATGHSDGADAQGGVPPRAAPNRRVNRLRPRRRGRARRDRRCNPYTNLLLKGTTFHLKKAACLVTCNPIHGGCHGCRSIIQREGSSSPRPPTGARAATGPDLGAGHPCARLRGGGSMSVSGSRSQ